jgi:ABC-type glutathione transport system ATPase component
MANNEHAECAKIARLRVEALSKSYVSGGRWSKRTSVQAVREASFEIQPGQTVALVGSSGCGKSTIARCIARLERPDSGRIWLEGQEIAHLEGQALDPIKMRVQMIFQDAVTSLNPRFSAAEAIEEPLRIRGCDRLERREIAEAVMQDVTLSPSWLDRSVMNFSGGQRQRLAIARALTTRPKLLILDEAFAGLDLSTQAQIANLLLELQKSHALSYLLISHDLTLVAAMADAVAVMTNGKIVENRSTPEILSNPLHEETKKLVASARAAELKLALKAGTSG